MIDQHTKTGDMSDPQRIVGIDLFCGAGGLSYGLQRSGIEIAAGFDVDPKCKYPFEQNVGAPFVPKDVSKVTKDDLLKFYPSGALKLLAGCAPCRPFSPLRRSTSRNRLSEWGLLGNFRKLVDALGPEFVTMENVTRIRNQGVFTEFVASLEGRGYSVDFASVFCPAFGVPQQRRRLVLVASLLGEISVPLGHVKATDYKTVRDTIEGLPELEAGQVDRCDPLHKARVLTPINLERIRRSTPGGTWHDWPKRLRAPCHKKESGASFQNVYSRMVWDEPSPTITTYSFNFGTGRFGHPEQDRAITLREAAMLQSFPKKYEFVERGQEVHFSTIGRLIGNAVPPRLAYHIGRAFVRSLG